jgi:polyisoprenoid-binding protein YceI
MGTADCVTAPWGEGTLIRQIARLGIAAACLWWATLAPSASAQEFVLRCDPAQTTANFTLGDVLHTVKGAFDLKRGELHFDPASGALTGEIIFDATSGHSGNQSRDRKMHKDVLESARYPEIAFHPDRVDAKVATTGTSSVKVHGLFSIHGAEHEITVPVEVKLETDHWSATAHFPVPYAKWGMKNPSVLFLRVGDSVDIDLHAAGSLAPAASH